MNRAGLEKPRVRKRLFNPRWRKMKEKPPLRDPIQKKSPKSKAEGGTPWSLSSLRHRIGGKTIPE